MNDEQTAFEKLTSERYLVSFRSFHNFSDHELNERGTFSHGNKEWDRELQKQHMRCYKAVLRAPSESSPQIFDIWQNGGEVIFSNPSKDLPKVHALIQRHLQDFLEYSERLKQGFQKPDQVIYLKQLNFIRELDKFASEVYAVNRVEFPKSTVPIISYLNSFASPFNADSVGEIFLSDSPKDTYTPITKRLDIGALTRRR